MKQVDQMLSEARKNRTWGEIIIQIKEGKPVLIRQVIQHKVEDYPANEQSSR